MAKKKSKILSEDGSEDEGCSTDQEHVNNQVNKPGCPHVGKAVHPAGLKKTLKMAMVRIGQCGVCVKIKREALREQLPSVKGAKKGKKGAPDKKAPLPIVGKTVEPSTTIWLCLRCGAQTCGPLKTTKDILAAQSHCLNHFKVPRSDLHCVCVCVKMEDPPSELSDGTLTTWSIVCFECNDELYIDSYKKLREALNLVKTVAVSKPYIASTPGGGTKGGVKPGSLALAQQNGQSTGVYTAAIPKGRGLTNLGNTCFFNAVAQCLSHSHPLTHVVDSHCQKGFSISLPGLEKDGENIVVALAEAGSVLLALTAFLKEMNSVGKGSVLNPGHLFGQVCKNSSQFRGYQQQDAHELLRHLMELLKSEEVKRQKSAILRVFGLSEKTDPKTVLPKTKRQLQSLSKYGNHTLVDKIFGGQLVSTVVCESCQNSSQIYEPFLDLSLPLVEEKPQRPQNKKRIDDQDDFAVTCFGLKKKDADDQNLSSRQEKAKKKKERKEKRKNRKLMTEVKADEDEEKAAEANQDDKVVEMEEKSCKVESGDKVNHPLDNATQEDQQSPNNAAIVTKDLEVTKPNGKTIETEKERKIPVLDKTNTSQYLKVSISSSVKAEKDETKSKDSKVTSSLIKDGNEEEDEDDGYSEEDEDWEWEYGEQWDENEDASQKSSSPSRSKSEYLTVPSDIETGKEAEVKEKPVSLNPLPPERLIFSEREKSSDPTDKEGSGDEEDDENSSNADVEDNLDLGIPNPACLDPHMEKLCRNLRKVSVSSAVLLSKEPLEAFASMATENRGTIEDGDENGKELAEKRSSKDSSTDDSDDHRKKVDWVAKSLTSIAPRYHAKSGECSVSSCLTQFTAPELLTGNNKWACDRCTRIQAGLQDSDAEDSGEKKTIYSNASKQLLIFSPPAVLTIHLKRFQQTAYNLRKVSRHVKFPLILDMAPFCSTTSFSTPNVAVGTREIKYYLFGAVEHSGRLHGGHYTAFVKSRLTNVNKVDYTKFYSSPLVDTKEIYQLLKQVEEKTEKMENNAEKIDEEVPNGKWYHISDSHVVEVTEEKVLKCQAYILFYERMK